MSTREFIATKLQVPLDEIIISNSIGISYDQYLTERFNNTEWLLDTIHSLVISTPVSKHSFDPISYYTGILHNILNTSELKSIANNMKIVPVVRVQAGGNGDYILGGKLSTVTFKNFLDTFRWNKRVYYYKLTLFVSDSYPSNKNMLITELDSIVGHEIEHLIQRIRRAQAEHNTPGVIKKAYYKWVLNKNAVINYDNSTNYVNTHKSVDHEIHYYLKHGELLAHAQTIGSYLYYQHGLDAVNKLNDLYRLGWKLNIAKYPVPPKAKWLLEKYSKVIHRAESENRIKNGRALWQKLFKEIHRVILNKER